MMLMVTARRQASRHFVHHRAALHSSNHTFCRLHALVEGMHVFSQQSLTLLVVFGLCDFLDLQAESDDIRLKRIDSPTLLEGRRS